MNCVAYGCMAQLLGELSSDRQQLRPLWWLAIQLP